MTALAGYRGLGGEGAQASCRRMLRAQQVYAPDGRPLVYAAGAVALGIRLHRLLPEDAFDRGPVVDCDGRVLIADIRIDNRDALCRDLGLNPADARQTSDSGLLSLALARWDEDALNRVVGDLAFAQWDPARRRLLLARDFLGQRPLHYHQGDGFVALASMPKGLHALAQVPRAPDRAAATGFLAHIPESDGSSFFEGVAKVPPGHVVVLDQRGATVRRYWTPDDRPLRLPSRQDYTDAVREQFDLAVASRLRGASGRVAAHLSGGLDSSSVTATAARQLAGTGRIVAYTSVPREGFVSHRPGIADEGPLAAAVAAMYSNIEHVRIRAGATSPLDALGRNAFLYERPYLNLCNGVWIDAINDDARRRGLRVLLCGTLGNATFSFDGMTLLPELLARGRLNQLAGEAVFLLRKGTRAGSIAAAALGPFLPRPLWKAIQRLRGHADGLASYSAIHPAAASDAALTDRAAATGVDFTYRPRRHVRATQLWMLGRVDLGNYNKGTLGGWGLDRRDPTADRRLVEMCLRLPASQYLHRGVRRSLARELASDRLPPAVLNETRKGFQGADWYEGFSAARGQLSDEITAIARDPVAAALIDTRRLAALAKDWPTTSWDSEEAVGEYRLGTLRGISTGHFLRNAAGTN